MAPGDRSFIARRLGLGPRAIRLAQGQPLHHLDATGMIGPGPRKVKRRLALAIPEASVRARLQERLHDAELARLCREMERSVAAVHHVSERGIVGEALAHLR